MPNLIKKEARYDFHDFAVMYRTNSQSRSLEESFVRRNIPYRLVGGTRFYERREVKDLLAYLRVIQNPFDAVGLLRIINIPSRGIGKKSVTDLLTYSKKHKLSPYSVLEIIAGKKDDLEVLSSFSARSVKMMAAFFNLINSLIELREEKRLSELLDLIISRCDYQGHIFNEPDSEERWDNVQELRSVAAQYDELRSDDARTSFLEDVSLMTDIDSYDEQAEAVTLITLHAAKGLEFDAVFLPGWEEGLFPHQKSLEEKGDLALEEERRLAYVGLTRAKKESFISFVMNRLYRGDWIESLASRFIDELPEENIKKEDLNEQNNEDFFFNQDIDYNEGTRSPGWARLQKKKLKRIK